MGRDPARVLGRSVWHARGRLKDGGREGIRTPGLLIASTFPITPPYIHVEKDFQSHHMQIYSSTLMGGQERERKCVRNA